MHAPTELMRASALESRTHEPAALGGRVDTREELRQGPSRDANETHRELAQIRQKLAAQSDETHRKLAQHPENQESNSRA